MGPVASTGAEKNFEEGTIEKAWNLSSNDVFGIAK